MMKRCRTLTLLLVIGMAGYRDVCAQFTIDRTSGDVQARSGWAEPWRPVREHPIFIEGDAVKTGSDGTITLRSQSGVSIGIRSGSIAILRDEESVCAVQIGTIRLGVPPKKVFEVQTATAVVGVRGTDFGVHVEETTRTTVYVFDGLVAVANSQMPEQEVLVKKGEKTVVEPFRVPAPPVSFESAEFDRLGGLGLLERGEDPIIESSEQPAVDRQFAFADPDIDAQRNPAYLAGIHEFSSTSLLTTGGYRSFSKAVGRTERSGEQAIFQNAAALPVGQHGVVGSFIQATRTANRTQDAGPGRLQDLMSIIEGRIIAAKRVGARSLGVSAMRYRSYDHQRPATGDVPGALNPVADTVDASSRVTAFGAGAVLDRGAKRTLAVDVEYQRPRSTTASGSLSKDQTGWATHLEMLYRRPVGSHFFGALGRIERSSMLETVNGLGSHIYTERLRVSAARGGIGFGFLPAPGTALAVDAVGGLTVEKAVRRLPNSRQILEDEDDTRVSASLHLGTQIRPIASEPWVFSTDVLQVFERSRKYFARLPGAPVPEAPMELTVHYRTTASVGIGYLWKNFFFDYLLSLTGQTGDIPPTHQLLIRHEYY